MLQILLPGVLIAIVSLAIRWDLLEHRIPNALCAPALAAGLALHVLAGGVQGLLFAIFGALTGLAALLPFYLLRGMGAGDVKLMAAVGSFLGPLGALLAAATTLALGAVIAIGLTIRQYYFPPADRVSALMSPCSSTPAEHNPDDLGKQRFPYAIAIAGGTLILMWYRGQLDQLAAAFVGWAL